MPYQIVGLCVHKENADGSAGRKIGCHATKAEAMAQMRALYASEKDEQKALEVTAEMEALGLETKEIEALTQKCYGEMKEWIPFGIKSFEELETWREAQEMAREMRASAFDFKALIGNIVEDPELGTNEKIAAFQRLVDEFPNQVQGEMEDEAEEKDTSLDAPEDEDKAGRTDVSPADRKRAVAEYGQVTFADPANKKYPLDNEKHIRAAWSYINMPKNAAKYSDKGAAVKRKIVSAWKRKIDKNGPPSVKKELDLETIVEAVVEKVKSIFSPAPQRSDEGFMVFKEGDLYKWIARYSNHFRDEDNPPEIISNASHQRFAERVDKGLAPKPELWLWHVKDLRIGVADWVAFDQDSGFALAGGHSLPGTEPVFEAMSKVKGIKVSHGMPKATIVRDATDESIIVEHETREISPLPGWAAANKLTGFVVLDLENKEAEMAIPDEKRQSLIKEWGLPEDLLAKIEAANKAEAEKAKEEGLQHKEAVQEPAQELEVAAAEPVAEQAPVSEPETPVVTAQDKAIGELIVVLKALAEKVDNLEKRGAEQEAALQKAISSTPSASILSMFGMGQSAIGNEATQVDGRTSLAKSKPAEAKPENEAGRTFVPFINQILAGTGQQS